MKIDHAKFADKAFESLGRAARKGAPADGKEPDEDDEEAPGHHGKLAIAAVKAGDHHAFEEAVRAIHKGK